jgi:hypothetical protein
MSTLNSSLKRPARRGAVSLFGLEQAGERLESRLALSCMSLVDDAAQVAGFAPTESTAAAPKVAASEVLAAAVPIADGLTITTSSVSLASDPLGKVQGFVDVYIDTPPNGTFSASGYEVSLRLQGNPAGVRFTGSEPISGQHPPLFPNQTPSTLGVGSALRVTDFLASGDALIADGAGMFRARFEVDAGVTGVFSLVFENGFTNVSNRQGQPVQLDALTGGTITVTGLTLPSLSVGNAQVTEGNAGSTDAVFTVTLSAASATPVTVDFATADNNATAGADYTPTTGRLTFPAGTTSLTVAVPVIGDEATEGNETFRLVLSNPSGATLGTATGTGTIVDDDEVTATNPWKNPRNAFDIDDDGSVLPLDALIIINALNDGGARPLTVPPVPPDAPPPYLDPSGDDALSPLDALLIINELNAQSAAAQAAAIAPTPAAAASAAAADLLWQAAADWHVASLIYAEADAE